MDNQLTLTLMLYHLLIALVAWGFALLLGGGLGYGAGIAVRGWAQGHPRGLAALTLLPWRAAVVWVGLVIVYSRALFAYRFGIGPVGTGVAVGLALLALIIPLAARAVVRASFPRSLPERILGLTRTTALLALALVALLGDGVGYFLTRASGENDFQGMTLGYVVIGAALLVVDVLLGLAQFGYQRRRGVKAAA